MTTNNKCGTVTVRDIREAGSTIISVRAGNGKAERFTIIAPGFSSRDAQQRTLSALVQEIHSATAHGARLKIERVLLAGVSLVARTLRAAVERLAARGIEIVRL